jgi:P-type conjugative transfer protein TrbJ
MLTTVVVIKPARAVLRLGVLSGVLSLILFTIDRVQASGVALFVALLAVALAVLTWAVWTVGGVLVSLAGLGVLLHRAGRIGLRGARALVSRGRALVGVTLLLVVTTPAQAQEVVIDPANLVQNTISALKMIESVINEATMIANQLEQIRVLIQNTTNYPEGIWDREALPRLLRLGRIIEQEQALAYTLGDVDRLFRQRYPGYRPVTDWSREYDSWTRTTLDTLRGTLNALRLHGEDFAAEQARIDSLTALSDTAVGRMQAVQTGNMIAAEQVQQLVKLRQLVMAQVNAQNVYMASLANREAQRAATQSEWVRNGNTDAPRLDAATSTLSGLPRP